MTQFIIASPESCIGCRTCEIACALVHEAAGNAFYPRLKVMRLDNVSVPVMCHQCENAPCVGACPVGALTIGASRIDINAGRCIGCQHCVVACPFGVITVEARAGQPPLIVKCDLCMSCESGPACINVCPTDALQIMTEQQLSALQKQRNAATAVLLNF